MSAFLTGLLYTYKEKELRCKLCFFFFFICTKSLCFTSGFESGLYLAVHLNACSHAMACSSVCDWQVVGWLLGASGEESVDFLLVVSTISRQRLADRTCYTHTRLHTRTRMLWLMQYSFCPMRGKV